jgi:hypothetical protein
MNNLTKNHRFGKMFVSVTFICALLIIGFSGNAYAIGLGAYSGAGTGSGDMTDEDYSNVDSTSSVHSRFGFVLDSNVAKDRLFNYRLKIGYETMSVDWKSNITEGDLYKASGLTISNTFGFGVLRNKAGRLWLGPEVKVSIMGADSQVPNTNMDSFTVIGLGIGLPVGMNLHIGNNLTIGFEGGYRYMFYPSDEFYYWDNAGNYVHEDFTTEEGEIFANLLFIFRINDRY